MVGNLGLSLGRWFSTATPVAEVVLDLALPSQSPAATLRSTASGIDTPITNKKAGNSYPRRSSTQSR
jgi:hypothetical protein